MSRLDSSTDRVNLSSPRPPFFFHAFSNIFYDRVCDAIRIHFPEHLAEFVTSVNTGMRLTEQYSCTWHKWT